MRYQITHVTTYRYRDPVLLGHNHAHLSPRSSERQDCVACSLDIVPTPRQQAYWTDYFGNRVTYFTIEQEHRELRVQALSQVQVVPPRMHAASLTPCWEEVRERLAKAQDLETLSASQFTFDSPLVRRSAEAASYAAESFFPRRPLLSALLDLTARIFRDFKYDTTATTVNTPTSEVFRKRRGVCQDFAHLQITCLRSLGLAARYVSGYLQTDPPPGQPKLIAADASHAWLSVYCPELGWLDVDPTNNQVPQFRHITLAWGRDYGDVCPIKGVFLGGNAHSIQVEVDVAPCNTA